MVMLNLSRNPKLLYRASSKTTYKYSSTESSYIFLTIILCIIEIITLISIDAFKVFLLVVIKLIEAGNPFHNIYYFNNDFRKDGNT